MKIAVIVCLVIFFVVTFFFDAVQASAGVAFPPNPGAMILVGSGVVGVAMMARNKLKR